LLEVTRRRTAVNKSRPGVEANKPREISMEKIEPYAPRNPNTLIDSPALHAGIRTIAIQLLAILTIFAFSYGLIAAEVKLAKTEQIAEPYLR
jgi:hypothetical protein